MYYQSVFLRQYSNKKKVVVFGSNSGVQNAHNIDKLSKKAINESAVATREYKDDSIDRIGRGIHRITIPRTDFSVKSGKSGGKLDHAFISNLVGNIKGSGFRYT
jgi:hypothetical protein